MSSEINSVYKLLQLKNLPVVFVRGKRPYTSEWQNNPVNLAYDSVPQGEGIGLLLGEKSGVVVLDLDCTDEDLKKEIKALIPDELLKVGRIGNPDKFPAIFCRMNDETRKKILFKNIDVEILSTGQQVVLPPSIHPDTKKPYRWLGSSLLDTEIENLPELPESLIADLYELNEKHRPEYNESTKVDLIPASGRCNHNSHSHLSSLCMGMLHGGEDIVTIVNRLLTEDEDINPNISYFLCPTRRWRTKNREANALWLVTDAVARNVSKGDIERINVGNSVDFAKVQLLEPIEDVKKGFQKIQPHLKGVGKEIFDFVYQNSPIPRSQFSYAAAITLMSTILGDKCHLNGISPNLYTFIIAPSGYGKNAPFSCIKQLLAEAELDQYLGAADINSPNSILLELQEYNAKLFAIDEAHKLFSENNKQASVVRDMLAELFTFSEGVYQGKRIASYKSGKERMGRVENPKLNLILTSTPAAFKQTIKQDFFHTGLGGRFLYFFEDRKKLLKTDFMPAKPSPHLIKKIKAIAKLHESEFSVENDLGTKYIKELTISDIDRSTLSRICSKFYKESLEGDQNHFNSVILRRKGENFIKLVQILHAMKVGEDLFAPIHPTTIADAKDNIDSIYNNFLINTEEQVTEGGRSDDLDFLLSTITHLYRTTRRDGVDKSILCTYAKRFNKRTRNELLEDLVESGSLIKKDRLFFPVRM